MYALQSYMMTDWDEKLKTGRIIYRPNPLQTLIGFGGTDTQKHHIGYFLQNPPDSVPVGQFRIKPFIFGQFHILQIIWLWEGTLCQQLLKSGLSVVLG